METWFDIGYFALFAASFLAATVLPMSSEGVLILMLESAFDPLLCIFIASTGNWLGGLTSYYLGSLAKVNILQRYFGVSERKVVNMKSSIGRYGAWSALLCWVPFIGDPIAVALGFFRVNFPAVAVLMLIGKALRYIAIAWLYF